VNFSDTLMENRLPTVVSDSRAVGTMVADYLLNLGHVHFAFWGDWTASYSKRQCDAFHQRLLLSGRCQSFHEFPRVPKPWDITPAMMQHVKRWLKRLPKPIAVFGALDLYATVAAELAVEAGMGVPDDLAVIGVGDDAFFANYGAVPVTSVRLPSEAMGRQVGKCLEAMFEGRLTGSPRYEFPPVGITERSSTATSHAGNPLLRASLAYIREHAMSGIRVDDVIRHSGYSPATLQNLFRNKLGRSILDEIWIHKLRGIKELISADQLTLDAIAEKAGLSSAQHLCSVFRKLTGQTPGQFRNAGTTGKK
jgi:LacI family transcriptional regulator